MARKAESACGTTARYKGGCRCSKCKEAWAAYRRDSRRDAKRREQEEIEARDRLLQEQYTEHLESQRRDLLSHLNRLYHEYRAEHPDAAI